MKKFGLWITNFFTIIAVTSIVSVQGAAKQGGVKAVILYMYDDATVGSNVVSMEVDKRTFMNVIKDSQFAAMSAKPLKFGQDNGFFALLDGESSSFSFATATGMADCDCKCAKKAIITTTTTTTTTQRPSTPEIVVKTTPRRTTNAPTYLPPTTLSTCPSGGSGPFCCPNGAANRDCCENGGRGKYCCINGANNPDCCDNGGQGKYCCLNGENNPGCTSLKTTGIFTTAPPTTRPACSNGGSGPFCCLNGATNADCCANGGKGKYCCTNGSNSPNCEVPTATTMLFTTTQPTVRTTTQPTVLTTTQPTVRTTKFKGPLYLPQPTIKTTRIPYVTQTYTYGSPVTYTYKYNWTHAPWSRDPKLSTVTYTTTTTPKYFYNGQSNRIVYAGEDENSV